MNAPTQDRHKRASSAVKKNVATVPRLLGRLFSRLSVELAAYTPRSRSKYLHLRFRQEFHFCE